MNSPVYSPRALTPGTLRVIPIGGLGEIGRNMTVFEIDGKILIVDCGVLFPEEHQPGVDLILPDFSPIRDRPRRRRRRRAHARPRGPHRRRPLPAAAARRHPADRLQPDARAGRGEAQGAPHHPVHAHRERGPAREARPVRPRVHRGQPLDPGCARRRHHAPRPARCCTPATSRWTSCRWTAGSPTCAPSRRLGEAGVDLFMVDSTNADIPGFTALRARHRPGASRP